MVKIIKFCQNMGAVQPAQLFVRGTKKVLGVNVLDGKVSDERATDPTPLANVRFSFSELFRPFFTGRLLLYLQHVNLDLEDHRRNTRQNPRPPI